MKIQYLFSIIMIALGGWISCGDTEPASPVQPPEQPSQPEIPDDPGGGKEGFIFSKIFSSEDDEVAIIYDIRQNDVPHIHLQWYDTCRLNKGQYLSFTDAGDACVFFRMWGDSISLSPVTGKGDNRLFPVPAPIPVVGDIYEKVFFNQDSIFYIKKDLGYNDGKITLKCVLKNQKIEIFPTYSWMRATDVSNASPYIDGLHSHWRADSTVFSNNGIRLEKSPFIISVENDNDPSSSEMDYSFSNVIMALLNMKVFKGSDYGIKEEKVSVGDMHHFLFTTGYFNENNYYNLAAGRYFSPLHFYPTSADVIRLFINSANMLDEDFIHAGGSSVIRPKMGNFIAGGLEVVSPFIPDGIKMKTEITEYKTTEYPYFGKHLKLTFVDKDLSLRFLKYLVMPFYENPELFEELCKQFFATFQVPEKDYDKVMDIIKGIPNYLGGSPNITFGFSYKLVFS